jgi:hypothetical protein
MSKNNILYYGDAKELTPVLNLQAGPVGMVYEAGFLRYLKVGGSEILRMIYFAVRDHNWDTIEGVLKNVEIDQNEGNFRISYTSVHQNGLVDITFLCSISGDENGHIAFSIEGTAASTFKKNRIGFCVLHPIAECIGKPCAIENGNGHKANLQFPDRISPHQPFKDIRSMQWAVNEDYFAKIEFYGDIFETEDQRNWTDASYKTYCTPLDIPFPVEIRPGDKVSQKVILDMVPVRADTPIKSKENVLSFSLKNDLGFSLPGLGCGASTVYDQLDERSIEKIRALQLDHIRWDLYLSKEDLQSQMESIQMETRKSGTSACLVLFFDKNPEVEYVKFVSMFRIFPVRTSHIILFSTIRKTTPDPLITSLVNRIRRDFPGTLVGGGTNAYFAELNRERIDHRHLDFVAYSINPQVHAFDHTSLTETLEAQQDTVKCASSLYPGKDIMVSPVTLKPRFNPNATGEEFLPLPGELPAQVDVRQMSLYGACWTLASIKYLAEAGARWVTYFETAGWKGLMQGLESPRVQTLFKSETGDIFPVYLVFKWLKKVKTGRMVRTRSSHPLIFDGLTVYHEGIHHLFLSNFSGEDQSIKIENLSGPFVTRSLSIDNVEEFRKDDRSLDQIPSQEMNRVLLKPCSINWIILKPELIRS